MDIHFCDLCNESVPQSDLDIGRAFMRKGRVVCATCDSVMSAREAEALAARAVSPHVMAATSPATMAATPAHHPAPIVHAHAAQSEGSGSGMALAAAALGIVLTLVLGYWAGDQFKQIRGGFDARAADLDSAQHRARLDADNAASRLSREVATLSRTVAEGDAEQRNWVDGKLRESAEQLRATAAQVGGLLARLDEQKVALDQLAQRDPQVASLEQRVTALTEEIKQMNTRLELALQAAASAAAAGANKPAVPENKPAWLALVEQLKSPSQSDRWQAVNALGETRDPAAAPFLIPLLQDKDLFVRMTTARALGDLGSPLAVSPLIATLGDSASPVREAAYLALRAITKRDLPFDPQTEDSVERNKRIHAWEEWWKKENGA